MPNLARGWRQDVQVGPQEGAKMANLERRCRQDGQVGPQEGAKMANLERKMANLTPFGELLDDFFAILGAIFEKIEKV